MITLSQHSLDNLKGVKPLLTGVVLEMAKRSDQFFAVAEGVRSLDRQLKDWLKGNSRLNGIPVGTTYHGYKGTGVGKHELGEAVDLVPVIEGKPVWDWDKLYSLMTIAQEIAIEKKLLLRWGGCWDKHLNDLTRGTRIEHLAYICRFKKDHPHKTCLCDGPHLELV